MENIYKIKDLKFFVFLLFLSIFCGYGQNNYFVYNTKGAPFMEVNDSIKSVTKGSIIDKNTILTMSTEDVVFFLDDQKQVYKLDQGGTFKYKDLKKVEPIKDNSSFTQRMFLSIWNKFTKNNIKHKNKSGVVYRGDDIVLMRHPADSIKIFYPEIKFEWNHIENKTKDYYFNLRDVESQIISKIGLKENALSLFVDEGLLSSGKTYEWTITETKFPNYEKTIFYTFQLLTASEFEALKIEIDAISTDLKRLGLDNNEIRKVLCEDYKVCF
jgi:hypothetical protein